jgi:hypothetical protein
VVGRVERVEGRKAFTSGVILLPDDTAAVEATGIYVEVPAHLIKQHEKFGQSDSEGTRNQG